MEGDRVFCGAELLGFMRFASAVGDRFERFVLVARGTGDREAAPYELPEGVELARLPGYPSLRRLGAVAAALPGTVGGMWRALGELDCVWVSGVHPFGLLFALMARLRRRRVALLIRQDSMRYFRSRLPSRAWSPLLGPIWLLELAFRLLARRVPTTVVGEQIAERYGAPRPSVLRIRVALLGSEQLAAGPSKADWSRRVELLSVGRIAPEKTPLVAARALIALERAQPGRYRLTWVGEGPMAAELERAVEAGGAGEALRLPGFVPFGPELLERYRGSAAFLHTASTEGVPGVLYEAMGTGLPVIATEVGGVGEALEQGRAGLLVPSGDAEALAAAVLRLAADPGLRRGLASRGLELAREATVESESERVAAFIAGPAGT